ncbi:MAG: response regulator [Alphaproteobacteria bacterium]|nr:response regulator [Alphaproteobacteria bacterium]MBU1560710.1 response regulator [Alphaproteobacteria bacterium]MBU2301906.1 response regulator [Alphaproteobacteria bacterium]MBU2368956.1 response regulator [Alphaproteobacteria bacterium]
MADRYRTRLVVSGDRTLWDPDWGDLCDVPAVVVLIVEDNALVRMGMSGSLAEEGFEVLEASNAAEALAMLTGHSAIGMMFTDINMGLGMDGLELAAIVHDRWPLVQIMVTSGRLDVDVHALPPGALFVAKPYSQDAVLETMQELVDNWQ